MSKQKHFFGDYAMLFLAIIIYWLSALNAINAYGWLEQAHVNTVECQEYRFLTDLYREKYRPAWMEQREYVYNGSGINVSAAFNRENG